MPRKADPCTGKPQGRGIQQVRSPSPSIQTDTAGSTICWTSYWWPVQAVENLDPKVPAHVDLLGKSLVIWGDSQGNWHCLEDKCPHRLAPLSEGRVEKDNIMCCYHGWTFSGSGSCTSIPQLASDPKAHDNACSSKRSCVTSYPTRVENGLLFVWPEAGPEAAAKAAAAQPSTMPLENRSPYYVRDLPIRIDSLIENLVDPAHVPYAHHGVLGDRNNVHEDYHKLKASEVTKDGFVATTKTPFGNVYSHFKPPYNVFYDGAHEFLSPQFWLVPTKPGWSRIIHNLASDVPALPLPMRALVKLNMSCTVYDHLKVRSPILDGDDYTLHVAERKLPLKGGFGIDAVARACYMPAPGSDAAVIALRKWFQDFAGDVPTCSPADEAAMPPLMTKEQVIERYHQHTKQCTHCMKALATLDRLQVINVVVGLAAAVALVAQAVAATALTHICGRAAAAATNLAAPSWAGPVGAGLVSFWQACQSAGLQQSMLGCGILALVCYGLYTQLAKIRQKFFYEDYVHALKN